MTSTVRSTSDQYGYLYESCANHRSLLEGVFVRLQRVSMVEALMPMRC